MRGQEEEFWADLPFGPGVRRVALDENGLAALDKPEGVLSHPNSRRDEGRSLVKARYDTAQECYEWSAIAGPVRRLWLVNRLDSATSGLILAATHGDLAREAREQFRRRQVRKTYEALVFGKPRQPSDTWRDLLEVRKAGGRIRTSAGSGRLPAESRMALVRAGTGTPAVSLIRLEPHTGRSHQLRVQCAKRGLPIVGDRTYGNFAANKAFVRAGGADRMFLHSLGIVFEYTFADRLYEFSAVAPLPPEFEGFR